MPITGHINDAHCAFRRILSCRYENWEEQSREQVVRDVVCLELNFEPLFCFTVWAAHNLAIH
jgi:hypothetical protein